MNRVDALVVGSGPTGLTMASELLRRGLSVRIIEKLLEPSPYSKALILHARSLEVFDDLGCSAALHARGRELHGASVLAGDVELARVDFDGLDTRYPFALCIAQADTEAVLRALLASRGGAIERGVELVGLTQDDDGVTAIVQREGREEPIHAA